VPPLKTTLYSPAQRRFGAHMSIAGGLHKAFTRAIDTGCDCLQIFVKNQRQWRAAPLTDEAIRAWRQARRGAAIEPVLAHDSYLINLASPDHDLFNRSIDAFVDELHRCEQLGILGLVTHPGSHSGSGQTPGIRRIARALNTIHRRTRGFKARTILETTAGQGTGVGHRFEQLARIIGATREPERVAVCVDTCHIFAAGYDLTTDAGYAETIAQLDQQLGLARVLCFHMNDSKKPMSSGVDRHEHIGKGKMGPGPFRRLINDQRFFSTPMILETPKGRDNRGRDLDRVNLAALRRLIQPG